MLREWGLSRAINSQARAVYSVAEHICVRIVMCLSTIIEHKNESVAKQLCMLFPIRVSLAD